MIGLGRSGVNAALLLAREGVRVYASDGGSDAAAAAGAARLARPASMRWPARTTSSASRAPRWWSRVLVCRRTAPPLAAARAAKVPIVSEIEVALRVLDGVRYIAITGTNGKTTTTALVGHLLRTLGHRVADAGNIGTPLTEIALREDARTGSRSSCRPSSCTTRRAWIRPWAC